MKSFVLFAIAALVLSMSGCTLFGGITNKIEEKNGKFVTTTTLYDYWNGEVVLNGECKTLETFKINGGNGVTDKTYKDCVIK